ncbi:MAG: UbiA-like polyprenyltransferase [Bdellovibrionota bacterium]
MSKQASVPTELAASFVHFASDIKLAHSIFALPFAVTGMLLSTDKLPTVLQCVLLVVCMVCARSFAMGMNRYIDRDIDKENPRTMSRKIPSGQLSASAALRWSMFFGSLFIVCAFYLNTLSGILSLPVLIILLAYSYLKRISWLTHWYLGLCLGLAPVAVSIALTGSTNISVILIGVAVTFWTAGFDILYSLQDREFDSRSNLYSYPSRFGPWRSVLVSRFCFAVMILALSIAGFFASMGEFYYSGVVLVAIILSYEHWLVKDVKKMGDSKHINSAFFTANAWVSVCFYVFVQLDFII